MVKKSEYSTTIHIHDKSKTFARPILSFDIKTFYLSKDALSGLLYISSLIIFHRKIINVGVLLYMVKYHEKQF